MKKTVRTRRGVEPTGRPARREVQRGRRARTNSSRTFAQRAGRPRSRAARPGGATVVAPASVAMRSDGRVVGRRRRAVVVNQSSFETRHISNISGGRRKRGRENVVDGCALSAPSCTTRGARRPRAPPSACFRHRKLTRRVDAPTITTTASRRRRDHDDAIFPKLKFLRDAESAREQQPDRHEELVVPLDLGAPAEFVLRRMSAMPQARPSLLGTRSTRKVQPVQSSRASFLWLFSSVAMVLCAALAP